MFLYRRIFSKKKLISYKKNRKEKMKKVIVFMVAGMSSRFGGKIPKQFAKVGKNNETLIEISVNDALSSKFFNEIIFITNPKTEHLFIDLFGKKYKNISVSYLQQKLEEYRERPWGTTDAVCVLNNYMNDQIDKYIFTIINGDDLYGKRSFSEIPIYLQEKNTNYIGGQPLLQTIIGEEAVNRGIITLDKNKVISIKETLHISRSDKGLEDKIANMNFLVVKGTVISKLGVLLNDFKEQYKDDPKIECFLTDSLNQLIEKDKIELYYFPLIENVIGITRQEDVEKVKKLLE